MIDPFRIKTWISWPLVRAHLCSLAVALSFNSTWRVPRDGYRYGALPYGLALTAMLAAAAPVSLLQLAVGQLSQQDAVGVWRAVPFFKGVGYLRLLASWVGAVYTIVYVALLATYFLYTANNAIPFSECSEFVGEENENQYLYNGTNCLNATFLSPASEHAEYFMAVTIIIIVLWIVFPFLLFNPVKTMKHALYPLGPVVLVLLVTVLANLGDAQGVTALGWGGGLGQPGLWFAAAAQALWSSQVAGGYLVSAGDTVYATASVQWTTLFFTASNILASWCSLLFWAAVGGAQSDVTGAAVLVVTYQVAQDSQLGQAWPMLIFAALFLSGIITMLTLLYPLCDRFRRVGGYKWRLLSVGLSCASAAAAAGALWGQLPALALLEDAVAPLLVCVATVLEVGAFVGVYGKTNLVDDIEFLLNRELPKAWTWGWFVAPVVIVPITVWWTVSELLHLLWVEPPWTASAICATIAVAILIVVVFAAVAIAKQVHYDFYEKLQESFKPSRNWGPRDPIAHYYWRARREGEMGAARDHFRPQLGQLSAVPSVSKHLEVITETKNRSNSDDWIYTVQRQQQLQETLRGLFRKSRSKSLDYAGAGRHGEDSTYFTPLDSLASLREDNNNFVDVKNLVNDSAK